MLNTNNLLARQPNFLIGVKKNRCPVNQRLFLPQRYKYDNCTKSFTSSDSLQKVIFNSTEHKAFLFFNFANSNSTL